MITYLSLLDSNLGTSHAGASSSSPVSSVSGLYPFLYPSYFAYTTRPAHGTGRRRLFSIFTLIGYPKRYGGMRPLFAAWGTQYAQPFSISARLKPSITSLKVNRADRHATHSYHGSKRANSEGSGERTTVTVGAMRALLVSRRGTTLCH